MVLISLGMDCSANFFSSMLIGNFIDSLILSGVGLSTRIDFFLTVCFIKIASEAAIISSIE